jgi:hypothetical protein
MSSSSGRNSGTHPFTVWQGEKAQVTLSRLENVSALNTTA